MFSQALAIARITFVESLRQPVFLIVVMLSAIFQVFNTLLSAYTMGLTEETEVSGDDKLLLDMGLATVLVCGTLLASFVATSVLSREIDNKTALTVISKPVGRPLFIFGKYIGVAGAMTVAMTIMTVFFLFAIRHEVMSTARDHVDGPVLLFGGLAILLSLGIGIWGNFFYGWVFPSTATGALLPLSVVAYVVTLLVSKEWSFQSPAEDFKPQILIACSAVFLSMFVLSAIAIAASTRLSQVMTITVCAAAMFLGLLSNYLVGRWAFENRAFGRIAAVEHFLGEEPDMSRAGSKIAIILEVRPDIDLDPGLPIFYGSTPEGLALAVPDAGGFTGDATSQVDLLDPSKGRGLVVSEVRSDKEFVIANANGVAAMRNPDIGDFVFATPTKVNPLALAAWGIIPNLQFFWLIDPITQGHPIPAAYMVRVIIYTVIQVASLLAVAVMLFQRRDVG